MAALDSAERAARTVVDAPVLFVGASAFGVLKLPVEVTRPLRISVDVYGVLALLTFAFTPALLAGLYGLASNALDGDVSPGDFWTGVGDGYGNLLLAAALYALVQHLLLLSFTVLAVVVFVLLAGGLGVLAEAAADPGRVDAVTAAAGGLAVAGVVAVSVVYVAVRATVAFFLQLYKPAAALDGHGPLGAFRESARLVRANVERTLAFVLVRVFATVVLLLPGVVAVVGFLVVGGGVFDQLGRGTAGVVVVAVTAVGFAVGVVELAFLATHRVAFYRAVAD